MKTLKTQLADKQFGFSLHPMFDRMQRETAVAEMLAFVPAVSFWASAMPDVLRLNEGRVVDAGLRQAVRAHRAAYAGLDRWFAADLLKIEGHLPYAAEVFGPKHTVTRDATYALVAEVFQAGSDAERIALVLAVECVGQVFFEEIAAYVERMGLTQSFQFLARRKVDVKGLFRQAMELATSEAEREAARGVVERVFAAFQTMFDGFEAACAKQAKPAFVMPMAARREAPVAVVAEAAPMAARRARSAAAPMGARRPSAAPARAERRVKAAAPKTAQRAVAAPAQQPAPEAAPVSVPVVAARRRQSTAPRTSRIRWAVGIEAREEASRNAVSIEVATADAEAPSSAERSVHPRISRPSRSFTGARKAMRRMPSWAVASRTASHGTVTARRPNTSSKASRLSATSGALKIRNSPQNIARPAMMPSSIPAMGLPAPIQARWTTAQNAPQPTEKIPYRMT